MQTRQSGILNLPWQLMSPCRNLCLSFPCSIKSDHGESEEATSENSTCIYSASHLAVVEILAGNIVGP